MHIMPDPNPIIYTERLLYIRSIADANKANQDSFSIAENFAGQETDAFFGVYDGHGRDGDKCAQFTRDTLPGLISKYVGKSKNREAKARTNAADGGPPCDPHTVELTKDQTQACALKAHIEANRAMHRSPALDDSLSGTTSISAYIQGRRNRITVSNVGDSRAIIGQRIKRQSAAPTARSTRPIPPSMGRSGPCPSPATRPRTARTSGSASERPARASCPWTRSRASSRSPTRMRTTGRRARATSSSARRSTRAATRPAFGVPTASIPARPSPAAWAMPSPRSSGCTPSRRWSPES